MKKDKRKSRSRSEKAQKRYGKPSGTSAKGKTFIGRVQKNPRGFAFLTSQSKEFEDAYVGKREAQTLLNQDTVEFKLENRRGKTEARIVRILSRGQTEVIGRVQEKGKNRYVSTMQGELHALYGKDRVEDGDWVIAKIDDYPTDKEMGAVSIKERLGTELSPAHDIPIALARYGLQVEFPDAVLDDAEDARERAFKEMDHASDYRVDQRHLPYVTIDGEDAKDFDDAVLVERVSKGETEYILYVVIADVSFFVEVGSALDKEALRRSTSVYFPGYCLPMLPETLSNDLCSLRPQTEKLAFTAELHFDRAGNHIHSRFYKSLIKTVQRLTYTQVHGYLHDEAPHTADLAKVGRQLEDAHDLFKQMMHQRKQRGVLDFDLPECKVELNRLGWPVKMHKAERFISHKMIEEFMIAANRAVAHVLRESNQFTLYRVHEAPTADSLTELNILLKNLGVNKRVEEVSPRAFARVLEGTHDLKGAPTLHQAILRLQKQAHYEPEPKGHFGLALQDYAHFTSPIRRYPDLVVHRSLNQLIGRLKRSEKRSGRKLEEGVERYIELGTLTSQRERTAMEAERFVVKRKQCWFMEERIGERFEGIVSGVTAGGMFVEIPEFALDGFVPLEFLEGFYELDERHGCLRKRPGHTTITVGDPFKIQVVRVSVEEAKIWFAPEEYEPEVKKFTFKPKSDR